MTFTRVSSLPSNCLFGGVGQSVRPLPDRCKVSLQAERLQNLLGSLPEAGVVEGATCKASCNCMLSDRVIEQSDNLSINKSIMMYDVHIKANIQLTLTAGQE